MKAVCCIPKCLYLMHISRVYISFSLGEGCTHIAGLLLAIEGYAVES